MPASRSKKRKTYCETVSEFSWLLIYYILTLESLYQVLREILLGLDWKQLNIVIKSMAFGI